MITVRLRVGKYNSRFISDKTTIADCLTDMLRVIKDKFPNTSFKVQSIEGKIVKVIRKQEKTYLEKLNEAKMLRVNGKDYYRQY